MKISFSTLGCPAWSFAQILENARAMGFDGVGFRGIGGELDLAKLPEFSPEALPETRRRMAEAGIATAGILSSAKLVAEADALTESLSRAESDVRIAGGLGAAYVRVFGGQLPVGLSPAAAIYRAAEMLQRFGEMAAEAGVMMLLETHDDWVSSRRVRRVMEAADHPNVGVLWDIHHTARLGEETFAQSWAALAPWIKACDLKDSQVDPADRLGYRYVDLGSGSLEITEAVRLLVAEGFDGWVGFEWEKRWHPELAEPEEAFPRFVATIRPLLGSA